MALETVPWMVGGGAEHSAEVGRLLAYAAFNGNEGIMNPLDLRVEALLVPGAGVRIAAGAAAITNRAVGQTYQSYASRNLAEDTVAISATGASPRSDMIVLRVEDPWLAGEPWADPPVGQEAIGPYVFFRVLVGVPSTAKTLAEAGYPNDTGIPLARIDIPSSTGTISAGMVKDLRKVANPRRDLQYLTLNPGAVVNLTSATLVNWLTFTPGTVDIPSWATNVKLLGTVHGAAVARSTTSVNGTAVGTIRGYLGPVSGGVGTQETNYDLEAIASSVYNRWSLGFADSILVPAALRGTSQPFVIQGKRTSGNKNVYADTGTSVQVAVEFTEVAVTA